MSATFYDLLGVVPSVGPAELRTAYRHRMLEVHPDKGGTVELCQRVMAAFERLSDPTTRRNYDQYLERRLKQKLQVGPQNNHGTAVAGVGKIPSRSNADAKAKHAKEKAKYQNKNDACSKKRKAQHENPLLDERQRFRGNPPLSKIAFESAKRHPTGQKRQNKCLIARIVILLERVLRKHRLEFIQTKLTVEQRKKIEAFVKSRRKDECSGHNLCSSKHHGVRSSSVSCSSADESNMGSLHSCQSLAGLEYKSHGFPNGAFSDVDFTVLALEDSSAASAVMAQEAIDGGAGGESSHPFLPSTIPDTYACIEEAGDGLHQTASGGAGHVRGISKEMYRGVMHYTAKIGFEWLHFRTKRRRNLSQAIDDHIILVAIKARAISHYAGISVQTADTTIEEALRCAISEVLNEHEIDSANFSMDIHISIPAYHWIGRCLSSPYYSSRELDIVLNAWHRFRKARGRYGVGGAGLLYRLSPAEVSQIWDQVRSVYVDVWSQRVGDVHDIRAKLGRLEASSSEHRCRQRENWERTQLEREERRQRAVEHVQAVARARQRQAEQKERRLMFKEDVFMQRRKGERKSLLLVHRLDALALRWTRQLKQAELAASRLARREHIHRAKEAQRSEDLHRQQNLQHQRILRAEHEARWRWMRRHDLTMEDILEGRRASL